MALDENDPRLIAINQVLHPIAFSVVSARKAIYVFEAIEKCAEEINNSESLSSTFGFIQHMSLEHAILNVCKLYDVSSKSYEKHTIPKLAEKINEKLSEEKFKEIIKQDFFGLIKNDKKTYLARKKNDFCKRKKKFLKLLKGSIPTEKSNEVLKEGLLFRNKKFAHAENLFTIGKKMPNYYPSPEGLGGLLDVADNFCNLGRCVFGAPFIVGFHNLQQNMVGIIKSALEQDMTSDEMISFYKEKGLLQSKNIGIKVPKGE